jgi:hypothetical protein
MCMCIWHVHVCVHACVCVREGARLRATARRVRARAEGACVREEGACAWKVRARACEGSARRKRSSIAIATARDLDLPPPHIALLSPLAASTFVAVANGAPRERPSATTVVQSRVRRRAWTARERSSNRDFDCSRLEFLPSSPSLAACSVCIRRRRQWRSTRAADGDDRPSSNRERLWTAATRHFPNNNNNVMDGRTHARTLYTGRSPGAGDLSFWARATRAGHSATYISTV